MANERLVVALLNPNCGGNYVQATFTGREHLGLGYLAAELRQTGFEAQITDSRILGHSPEQAASEILDSSPFMLGVSLIAKDAASWTEAVVKIVRQKSPDIHTVVGNYFPSLQPQRAFKSMPSINSLVIGEGDITFPQLAQLVANGGNWKGLDGIAYRHENQTIINPGRLLLQNLDLLPFPEHTASRYGLREFAMRGADGCYMRCTFCSIDPFFNQGKNPTKWRPRSPQSIAIEMAQLQTQHPDIKVVRFVDPDSIGAPKYENRMLEFAEELRLREVNLEWIIDTRTAVVNGVSDQTWTILRQAGLREVFLGIETTDPRIKRMMDKRTTFEQDQKAVEKLIRHGIRARYGFMMITPWSTEESLPVNAEKISKLGFPRLDKFFQEMFVVPRTRAEEMIIQTHQMWFDHDGQGEYYSYNLPLAVDNFRTLARTLVSNNQDFLTAHLQLHEQVRSLLENPTLPSNVEQYRDALNQLSLQFFMEIFNRAKANPTKFSDQEAMETCNDAVAKYQPILQKAVAEFTARNQT